VGADEDEDEETDPLAFSEAMVDKLTRGDDDLTNEDDELTKEDKSTSLSGFSSFSTDETNYEHQVYANADETEDNRPSAIRKTSFFALNPAAIEFIMHDAERAQLKTSFLRMEQQWLKQKQLFEERMKDWHVDTKYDLNVQSALDATDVVTNLLRSRMPHNKYLNINHSGK